MKKYKVGDRVKLCSCEQARIIGKDKDPGLFIPPDMIEAFNRIHIIQSIGTDNRVSLIEGSWYSYSIYWFIPYSIRKGV